LYRLFLLAVNGVSHDAYSAPSRACFKGKLSAYRQAGPLRLKAKFRNR
jgi:hypothetical protein